MKKFKNFFKNYKRIIYASIILVCSCLGMTFAYMYGASDPKVYQYSSLVSADLRAKKENLDFLHGYVDFTTDIKGADQYKNNIALQQKTIHRHRYFNTYLLSTRKSEILDYETRISFVGSEKSIDLGNSCLGMVRNYWDYQYMESIGLPLIYVNENESKNNIGTRNSDVSFGCYISSTQAYEMAVGLNLINDGEEDLERIGNAFNTILDKPDEFYLTLKSIYREPTFTVNNIYIDSPKFFGLLNSNQKSISFEEYCDYYSHFGKYNKNLVFTHADHIFSDSCRLYFDIVESTSNIDIFINNILGKEYAFEESKIVLKTGYDAVDSTSDLINDAYLKNSKSKIVYFIFSFVFFEFMLLFAHTNYMSLRDKKRYTWIYKLFLPALPFICLWTFLSIFMTFSNNKASLFFVFNYYGNIIIVIFLLMICLFGYIFRLLGDDDEKLYL